MSVWSTHVKTGQCTHMSHSRIFSSRQRVTNSFITFSSFNETLKFFFALNLDFKEHIIAGKLSIVIELNSPRTKLQNRTLPLRSLTTIASTLTPQLKLHKKNPFSEHNTQLYIHHHITTTAPPPTVLSSSPVKTNSHTYTYLHKYTQTYAYNQV